MIPDGALRALAASVYAVTKFLIPVAPVRGLNQVPMLRILVQLLCSKYELGAQKDISGLCA